LQWDTAGQEKFRKITFGLYRGAHGIILAYDITKKATLDNLDKWLKDITDYGGEKVTKIVAGNKTVRVCRAQNTRCNCSTRTDSGVFRTWRLNAS
jgi:GTPase SAR1 family protein